MSLDLSGLVVTLKFYLFQDHSIRHKNTGQCLQKPDHSDTSKPLLRPCDNSVGQQWVMDSKFKWQAYKA
jgi:polypeptide N-acetylgalactosaminyltransferase